MMVGLLTIGGVGVVWMIGSRDIRLNKDDLEEAKEAVLRAVPVGTSADEGRRVLEADGFECVRLENTTRGGEPARAVQCSRGTWFGFATWSVVLWLAGEDVADVSVLYAVTAP